MQGEAVRLEGRQQVEVGAVQGVLDLVQAHAQLAQEQDLLQAE